jgi:hypothetical protein
LRRSSRSLDRTHRSIRSVALVVALTIGAACTGADGAAPTDVRTPTETPSPSVAAVVELRSIDTLRDRFEADAGTVRLLLLLSPT